MVGPRPDSLLCRRRRASKGEVDRIQTGETLACAEGPLPPLHQHLVIQRGRALVRRSKETGETLTSIEATVIREPESATPESERLEAHCGQPVLAR